MSIEYNHIGVFFALSIAWALIRSRNRKAMIHELKITSARTSASIYGIDSLVPDYYLIHLKQYLFDNRGRIPRILEILQDPTIKRYQRYGGNAMFIEVEDPTTILICDYDPEDPGIRINRADLIEIFKAWLKIDQVRGARDGIREMILQRDEEHISIIVGYGDGSVFRRMFNYKVKE